MARVVMSDALIKYVREQTKRMYPVPDMPAYSGKWANYVYHILVPQEDADWVAKAPEGWLLRDTHMRIRLDETDLYHATTLVLPERRPMPHNYDPRKSKLVGYQSISSTSWLTPNKDPIWDPFKADVKADADRIAQAKAKQEGVANEVVTRLSAFSSLAPALRDWPALWELLPPWAQEKHREVVVRKAAAPKEPPPEIDVTESDALSELTAKLGMRRLAQGN